MKYDIVLSGVGGQGVLSLAVIIAKAAVLAGLTVRQSEVHGMAQRGGAVLAHLRLSDAEIHSDLISRGGADMILSMEPLESLRYAEFLSPSGILVTAKEPFVNIGNYPDVEAVHRAVQGFPRHALVPALELAKAAGSPRATNMVLVGTASKHIPVDAEILKTSIRELFSSKGDSVVGVNIRAFESGRNLS